MSANVVRQALSTALSNDTTLTALLSATTAIFHRVAPQDAETPFIVLDKQSSVPSRMFGGRIDSDVWIVKAIDLSGSASTAETISARIDVVLDRVPLVVAGRKTLICWRISDVDYPEQAGARTYQHVGGLYRIETQP